MRKYVDDSNLQIAMTEYNDNSINREVEDQYDRSVGTVTQVYNNTTGAGEQVYAVVKNTKENAEDVEGNYAIL
ncbi:hypothetical protein DXN33_01315 [Streptococcus sp. NM]|uniref:hypothetical protein n=1 Tax=Streptococcus sp. NM TaxID=2292266 RepID=UPI000E24AC3F|nr:hypothetical protein [Streptococcus sp. NM]REK93402.1 hypothetical protein DXN33_01315 [Streptococcus sp. NM]